MRIPFLAVLGSLFWLATACVSNEETRAQRAADARLAQQRLDKAIRDTATVAGLHGLVLRECRREEYALAYADLRLLRRRYPHSVLNEQLAPLGQRLDSLAAAQQQREATRQQRQGPQPAPLAWRLEEYTDEFGKPAGRLALANADIQRGTISTDGGADSPLVVRILADSSAALHLLLYDQVPLVQPTVRRKHRSRRRRRAAAEAAEAPTYTSSYQDMHLYRVAEPVRFTVKVRRHDGRIDTLPATMLADRLVFDKASSRTLHECLLQGGEVGFLLGQPGSPATSYRFTIANADAYEAGYYSLIRRGQ